MTQDKIINDIGKTLEFFKYSGIRVHINVISGVDAGRFRNGVILDLDLDKRDFLIVDDVLGNKRYSFYEIDPKIVPCRREE